MNINKVKLLVIIIAGVLSTGSVYAQDAKKIAEEQADSAANQTSNNSIKEIEERLSVSNYDNFANSLQKSNYRNEEATLRVQEDLLDRQISLKNKILENKKLDYMLNLPIEAHIDQGKFYNILDDEPKGFQIVDESTEFKEFVPPTYEIDQLIFEERESKEEAKPQKNVQQQSVGQNLGYQSVEPVGMVDSMDTMIDLGSYADLEIVTNEPVVSDEPQIGITDEELAALNITREEYESWLSSTEEEEVEEEFDPTKEEEIIEEPEEFLEVKNFTVSKILIFGEKKKADIGMDIYVGDGITGEDTNRSYTNVAEGEIISFDDYQMEVVRVDKTEVELKVLSSGKKYIATTTYK